MILKNLIIISIILINLNIFSQDLLVTPKRIVYNDKSNQKQVLNLVNTGIDTVIYNISFVNYRMTTDGKFEEIYEEDSLHMFSEKYLRVFPRHIILPPKEPQLVSIQYRRNSNMIKGEYRSHLYLRSEVNNIALGNTSQIPGNNQLGIQLTPIYGITIPIIIKKSEDSINVHVIESKLKKIDDDYYIDFTISREGDFSFYGDIEVLYSHDKSGVVVSRVNGIALYTDVNERYLSLKLDQNSDFDYNNGFLTIKLWSNVLNNRIVVNSYKVDLYQQ